MFFALSAKFSVDGAGLRGKSARKIEKVLQCKGNIALWEGSGFRVQRSGLKNQGEGRKKWPVASGGNMKFRGLRL